MSQWVDFRVLKQSMGIEQVLVSYGVELKRVAHHQLRGLCRLPTHGSERSRQSLAWTPQRTCGRVIRLLAVRHARAQWAATF
jgi:hypothetical protein